MDELSNYVELHGVMAGKPEFSHASRNEKYYTFPLEIERLSGTSDTINIIIRSGLMESLEIEEKQRLAITGELRSFNNKSGEGSRLVITVFAKTLILTDEDYKNTVILTGVLCKPPNLRRTPMGREICDMMLAVNRRYGRSDYLPCIAWGQLAEAASELEVGSTIRLEGRIQSRKYIKMENGRSTERTAFEVSAVSITR